MENKKIVKNKYIYKNYKITFLITLALLIVPLIHAASPVIVSTNPYDGEMAVKPNSTIYAVINDTDNDILDINFSIYNGTSWRVMRTYNNVLSGNYSANTNGFMTKTNTFYQWKITIDDHTGNITEQNFTLKTRGLLKLKYAVTVGASNPKGEGQIMPLMADIDKDGIQEIVMAAGPNVVAINGMTGQIEWSVPGVEGTAIEMADLNNDGTMEILVGTASSNLRVMAINGNGSIRWTSPRLSGEHQSLFPLLAYDTDGDGYPTIYFGAQDSHPDPYSGNISEYNGAIQMLNHNGQLINKAWVQKPCWGGFAIGDTDNDGSLELYMGDRRDGYHNIPGKGLYALDALTLEEIWTREDIQHSSPLPVLADVFGDENMEVIGTQITLSGPLVLDSQTGTNIKDYQSKGLPTHATGTVADIDNDGNLEMTFGTSYPSNAPKDFAIFDLVTGVTEFRPKLEAHTTWPPKVADITGDGNAEIIVALGEQSNYWDDYPIIIYDNEYNIIDRVDMSDLKLGYKVGQFSPARFFDVDNDGLNELVIGSAGGRLLVFETQGVTPNPKPRTWVQEYSEYRTGEPVYVDLPGAPAPVVKSVSPLDGSVDIGANPVLKISAIDYQKDKFNVLFEIYHGFTWKTLASYNNVSNGNFSANTTPYVTDPSTEFHWRVTLTDVNGNSKQYEYNFVTTNAINTTKPIINEVYPTDYMGAVLTNTTALVFDLTNAELMTYNLTTIPNIGSGYAINVASGQYSVPISGLEPNTEYIWRIEVKDNESISYREYHFSTPWDLNVSVLGNGVVQTTPDAPFAHNSEVNITATANLGNTFLGWIGDISGYNSTITILLDTPKSVTARFREESGKIIADGEFDQSLTSLELIENAPYQDWYESRNQANYRLLLPSIDEFNVGGNSGKKLKLNGNASGNAYITQEFLTPLNDTFSLQWDVYVDNILNIAGSSDKAAIMLIGDNVPVSANGPNYQATRNFVWLAFHKTGGAETGLVNLITTKNNGVETVIAENITLDEWHTIRVDGNLDSDTYDVYLDGLMVVSGTSARTNKTSVTHISFAQWNDGAGTFYIDNVGVPSGPIVCTDSDLDGFNVTGLSCGPIDCNDADASVNPEAVEVCDSIDNNCNGNIDEGLTSVYFEDSDLDLFGNPLVSQNACSMPLGYVTDNTDCDDSNIAVNPLALEVCANGIDDNCNGNIDEGCDPYDAWSNRKAITIDNANVASDVSGFPLLLSIDDSDLSIKAQANGDDIFFTDASLNKLSHEIESYDSGALIAWIKTDLSTSSDTIIYMYYGNPLASNQQDSENVWDGDYLTVQHLEESSGQAEDSTSNSNDGTLLNGLTQDINGKIGDGYSFDGVDDRMTFAQMFSSETEFTVEAWVNTASKHGYILSQRNTGGQGAFLQYYPLEGNFQMYVNNRILRVPANAGAWHHVVGTYDGVTARLYVDALSSASGSATITWPVLNTLVGDRDALARAFQGGIDELRVSDVARSQAYITMSYNNQNNPETFYTVGSEE